MIIRILMLGGLAAIGYLVFLRRNKLPIHIVLVFVILGAGGVAVLFPERTDDIANYMGVGRGVDLIMYIFEVGTLFVLIHYYTKFVEVQRQLTVMTRELAIMKAEQERAARPPGSPPPS